MFNERRVRRDLHKRTTIIRNFILGLFFIILLRLWYLQIYKGKELFNFSLNNWLKQEIIKAPRGMIFDRNNQLLVHNIPRIDAVIIPQYLLNKEEIIKKLSIILEMRTGVIKGILNRQSRQARYRSIIIKKNISKKEIAIIETESAKLPGVFIEIFSSREYIDKEVGANYLGYINEISKEQIVRYRERDYYDYKQGDYIGQSGIELNFDLFLRGIDGYKYREIDARGRVRRLSKLTNIFKIFQSESALPGNNIKLTIDRELQLIAHNALEDKVGTAVAVDVTNGDILAMVSLPSFDPTLSRRVKRSYWNSIVTNPFNPLRDRAVQEHYAPGSTFKTFTAIAALEEGIITPEQKVNCEGTFQLGRRVYHDWKKQGHGITDLYRSLRRSVDVYYYKIGVQLDIDILASYARLFGFGSKTGVPITREIAGLIPTKEWKLKKFGEEWQKGETISCSIGQSYILTTPIQLLMAYAAIANNGKLFQPNLIKEIFNINGDIIQTVHPILKKTIKLKEGTLKAIKQGLYEVVNHTKGTAWWHRGRGIRMSGKTGTSQVRSMTSQELFSKCKEMPYKDRHHGIFVGYAPYQDPKIAVVVVVEHGCSGSSSATPIATKIITKYMQKYYPDRYKKYFAEDLLRDKKYWASIKQE